MALLTAFLIGLALALMLTPFGTRAAWATGYLDHPEARKLHTQATALLGGAVIFVSALIAWYAAFTSRPSSATPPEVPFLVGGAVLVLFIGLWDDRFGMAARLKFLGQGTAAAILLASGNIPHFGLPWPLDLILAWVSLIALMNAINFLDNMNGVVGGLSAILLAAFAWLSASRGQYGLAAGQLAVAGACIGFLRYNFPRARIFLGDAGSLFLGYCLGASALLAYVGAPEGWGRVGPILMLGYPAFDLFFVVITRKREGRKVSEGGKDHTNHRIASVLRCQKRTVILLWVSGVALSVSGLAVLRLNQPLPALVLLGLWIALFLWVGTRLAQVPVPRPSTSRP